MTAFYRVSEVIRLHVVRVKLEVLSATLYSSNKTVFIAQWADKRANEHGSQMKWKKIVKSKQRKVSSSRIISKKFTVWKIGSFVQFMRRKKKLKSSQNTYIFVMLLADWDFLFSSRKFLVQFVTEPRWDVSELSRCSVCCYSSILHDPSSVALLDVL